MAFCRQTPSRGPGLFLQAQRDETLRLGGDVPPHLAPLLVDATNGDLGIYIYMGYGNMLLIIWESYCGHNFRKAQLPASCKQLQSPEWGSRQWESSAVKP